MMKFLLFFLISLVVVPKWVFSDIQLVSSGPGVVRPGENLHLVCKVTGFSITTQYYYWNWIRQPPGKGLEWVAAIYPYGGNKYYAPSLKSRTTISSDTSKNEFSLQLNSLTAADSAVYFCARAYIAGDTHGFRNWGQGTLVTVTSATQSPPSLFPLTAYGETPNSAGDITIGCLAKDFLPGTITFSWNNPDNSSLAANKFRGYPVLPQSSGPFLATSLADVPASKWENREPFYCKAAHSAGNREIKIVPPIIDLTPPEMSLLAPAIEAFSGPYLNATLLCKVTGLSSNTATLQWLKDDVKLDSGFTTTEPAAQSIVSELTVIKSDWISEKKFTCQVKSGRFNESKTISMSTLCKDPGICETIQVTTIPPSFADTYQTKSAKLTCRVSNIPYGQDLKALNITWTRASDNKQLETVIRQPQDQDNNMLFVDAEATVCVDEWNNSQETFKCKVAFPGLLPTPETKSLKKPNGGTQYPPAVYVLSPPTEELALHEKATVSALIKDFYPNDLFVKWLRNGVPVPPSQYFVSKPVQESKTPEKYSAFSLLNVNEQDWNSGDTFTCVVGHEALPVQTIQKSVDKNTGKPSIVNVSLVLSDAAGTCY